MRKYIFILDALELMTKLIVGKRVEGVLYMDENTGRLTFKAYNRTAPRHRKDRLVKKLPWGWVRESMERLKVFGSFPKDMGTAQVLGLLEEHTQDAMEAIAEEMAVGC